MLEHLKTEDFKKKVFDYEKNSEWKFEGNRPCIVDFYAPWCGPCKMVAPVLEKLADKYEGRVDIFKVDTDAESELSSAFGISSVPTIVFVPQSGDPQAVAGALTYDAFETIIRDVLKVA